MLEWKKIWEVFETRNGYTPSTKDKSFWEGGTIPWFKMEDIRDCGTVLCDSKLHITEKAVKGKGLFKANSIILATSATIGEHALVTVEHLCNQRFTNFYPKKEYVSRVNMKYVYYFMFIIDKWCQQHTHQGGFASVDMDGLYKLEIPIPSLSEQTRIVGILDTFTASIENLKQQIAQRRKQYEHYRDQLLDLEGKDGVEMKTLGLLCEIKTGKLNANAQVADGLYPFFTCDAKPFRINTFAFDTEAVIISGNGSQVGHLNYYKGKFNAYQRTYVLCEFRDISIAFLFHYLKLVIRPYVMEKSKKGSVPYITLPMLQELAIPVPFIDEQQRIVSILDTFEASIANLEQQLARRERQYEYYRNKLLTFE